MSKEMLRFYKACENWLVNLGFVEIFRDNHPDDSEFNVHFIKDGIRVCCRKRFSREECYFNKIIYLEIPLTIRTGNYEIGTKDLEKIMNILLNSKIV